MRRTIRLILLAGALLWSIAMPVSGALAAGSSSSSSSSSSSAASAAAGSAASSAPSGVNPFSGSVGSSPVVTLPATTPVTTSSSSSSSGFSGLDALIIGFVAILLIIGVGFYVWFDARQHVPRGNTDYEYFDSHQRKGSKAPTKSRKLSATERKRRKRGRAR